MLLLAQLQLLFRLLSTKQSNSIVVIASVMKKNMETPKLDKVSKALATDFDNTNNTVYNLSKYV